MSVPPFIEGPGGELIGTNQVLWVKREGASLQFVMAQRKPVGKAYATEGEAIAALAGYAALLETGGPTPTAVGGLVPHVFNQALPAGPFAGFEAVLYGAGFSSGLNPTVTFSTQAGAGAEFVATVTVLNSQAIKLVFLAGDTPPVFPLEDYDVIYHDDAATELTLSAAATLVNVPPS